MDFRPEKPEKGLLQKVRKKIRPKKALTNRPKALHSSHQQSPAVPSSLQQSPAVSSTPQQFPAVLSRRQQPAAVASSHQQPAAVASSHQQPAPSSLLQPIGKSNCSQHSPASQQLLRATCFGLYYSSKLSEFQEVEKFEGNLVQPCKVSDRSENPC